MNHEPDIRDYNYSKRDDKYCDIEFSCKQDTLKL